MSSELRWVLALLGAVFIGVLALWEWRRPRQGRGGPERELLRESAAESAPLTPRDPFTLPPMRAREPAGDVALPVVGLSATRPLPVLAPAWGGEAEAESEVEGEGTGDGGAVEAWPADREAPAPLPEAVPTVAAAPQMPDADAPWPAAADAPPAPAPQSPAPEAAAPAAPRASLPELPAAPPPIVDWPPETERRILAVRLVATHGERIAGRALRLALAAEGFLIGPLGIFHKPDEAHRAVLSAASLTRPGTFDLQTMDSQHYGGLSLFAVLPGPKPAPQAFEDLVYTARALNERLQGVLQDESGSPLTSARVAQQRERLRAGAKF